MDSNVADSVAAPALPGPLTPPLTRIENPESLRSQSVELVVTAPVLRSTLLGPVERSTVRVRVGASAAVGDAWTLYSRVTRPAEVAVGSASVATRSFA